MKYRSSNTLSIRISLNVRPYLFDVEFFPMVQWLVNYFLDLCPMFLNAIYSDYKEIGFESTISCHKFVLCRNARAFNPPSKKN